MKVLTFWKVLALVPLAVGLTQCDRIQALIKPKAKGDPYAFDVVLEMSPRAETALKKGSQGLYIDASYYGYAAPAYKADADKLNRIYLGEESGTYSSTVRKIHLRGEPIERSELPETVDGQPQVLLSVTMMGGDPDDLMTCHYIGSIHLAQQHRQYLHCEFDTESYWDNPTSETPAK